IVDEAGQPSSAAVHWRLDSTTPGAFSTIAMHDDGAAGDALANDGLWTAVIPPQANGAIVEFYVSASDGSLSRTWPGPTDDAGTQGANALYQVDNTPYAGTQPLFRLIMTEAERAELRDIGDGGGGAELSNAQMNGTFISIDPSGSQVRY